MRADVRRDFDWQARFKGHFAEIALGVVRVAVASWDDDVHRNTDMVVATLENGRRVACRARRRPDPDDRYGTMKFLRYQREFTIRLARPTGAETEMSKIHDGWGDFMIYGFEAEVGAARLFPWVLFNLHLFREYMTADGRWTHQKNHDGTQFAAFKVEEMPLGLALNSDGYPSSTPAVGPCAICGRPSWFLSDDGCPIHLCCSQGEAGVPCDACRASDEMSNYRYGWPAVTS